MGAARGNPSGADEPIKQQVGEVTTTIERCNNEHAPVANLIQ